MSKMSDAARAAIGGSGTLTGGLEKIKLDDLIAAYPDGVAVNGFDIVNYQGATFPVFTFCEDASRYFSGGMALKNMANRWLEICGGNIEQANAELAKEPVILKMEKVKTKNKRDFTKVSVMGTLQLNDEAEDLPPAEEIEYDKETGEIVAPF